MRNFLIKRFQFKFISPSEATDEQGDCHRKGVIEKPPCGGRNMVGRGQYEIPLLSLVQLLMLDIPFLSLILFMKL